MPFQVLFGSSAPDRRPLNDNVLTLPEQELISWFTVNSKSLAFEKWEKSQVTGYRTITSGRIECCIRFYRNCLYSNGNTRWNRFGILPRTDGHWYFVTIRDTLKLSGKKKILEFAAGPTHGGYGELKMLYDSISVHCENAQFPLLPLNGELNHKLLTAIKQTTLTC